MATIHLQPDLLERIEKLANERAMTPDKLVETTIRAYLRQAEREKIQAEIAAYRSMHPDLVRQYRGQYVAVHDGQVVDHDVDFQALHRRVRERFGRQAVLLRQVEEEVERELTFRSPRFERGRR